MSEQPVTWADVERAAKSLAEQKSQTYSAVMHPMLWNGFWYIGRVIPFFRWLGRKLHSRRLYWLGFQVEWVQGIKELF